MNTYDLLQSQKKAIDADFRVRDGRFTKLRKLAADLDADIKELGFFVELHTASVCPDCSSVCCINRHSYHAPEDLVYIHALGGEFPLHARGLDNAEPCQFLGHQGCTIQRSLRPYRCNWYFCSSLLEHISGHNSRRQYRFFISLLERITGKRLTLMEEYASVSGRSRRTC